MSVLKIANAEIRDFLGLTAVCITASGNHVLLQGVNGSGKSAVLEALKTALRGKRFAPADAVRRGAAGSSIRVDMHSDDGQLFRVQVDIRESPDRFDLEVLRGSVPTVAGIATSGIAAPSDIVWLPIRKPMEFLQSIVADISCDPYEFLQKSDTDQAKALVGLRPGLQKTLDSIDEEFQQLKARRSTALQRVSSLEVDCDRCPATTAVPPTIDTAAVAAELRKAQEFNSGALGLQQTLAESRQKLDNCNARAQDLRRTTERLSAQISAVSAQLKALQDEESRTAAQLLDIQSTQEALTAATTAAEVALKDFRSVDEKPLLQQLADAQRINAAAAEAQLLAKKAADARTELQQQKTIASELLVQMKATTDRRTQAVADAGLQIPGLQITDGVLLCTDPASGQQVPLRNLSEGQKIPVLTRIFAAALPDLRVMFVPNYESLDKAHRKALLNTAAELHLQLWMHESIQEGQGLHIEIIDGNPAGTTDNSGDVDTDNDQL